MTPKIIIKDGTIEDIIQNIPFIREKISLLSHLDEEFVRDMLADRRYGVKIAADKELSFYGLTVWFEDDDKDLYIWITAMKEPRSGAGSETLREIAHETNYKKWYAETAQDNVCATKYLKKLGFREYIRRDNLNLITWEKIWE